MEQVMIEKLIDIAIEQLEFSYTPYSNFKVGAALLTRSGEIYTGCNIENASYGVTICAERVALFKAVSEGKRTFSLLALTSDSEEITYPCGICRQALSEFAPHLTIVCASSQLTDAKIHFLDQLLPYSFSKEDFCV